MDTVTPKQFVLSLTIEDEHDLDSTESPVFLICWAILFFVLQLIEYIRELRGRKRRRAKLLMPLLPITERRPAYQTSSTDRICSIGGTSFLHLPPEIRQEILIESCVSPLPTMSQLQYQPSPRQLLLGKLGWQKDYEIGLEYWVKSRWRDINIMAQYLRCVHSVCNADMDYVVKRWTNDLIRQKMKLEEMISQRRNRHTSG